MKIQFDSPLDFQDGQVMPAAVAATLAYTMFIDTVNPPVKSYPVPQSLVAAATKNANGSYHVTIDAAAGQLPGFTPVVGTTYYLAVNDAVTEGGAQVVSPDSNIVTYTYTDGPQAPVNFTVVS